MGVSVGHGREGRRKPRGREAQTQGRRSRPLRHAVPGVRGMEIETVSESFRSIKRNEWSVYPKCNLDRQHHDLRFWLHASPSILADWEGMTIFSCTSEIVRTRATRGPNRFHERGNRPLRRHLILCTSSLSTDRPTVEGEREGSGLWIVASEGAVAKLESEIEGVPASPWVRDEPPDNSLSAISGRAPTSFF